MTSTELPIISSLWIGDRLSYLEQLCLKSFADRGHKVKLYAYEEILNVPDGVELVDANLIVAGLHVIMDPSRKSPAKTADKFRYSLLSKTDEIWVDCDAYCVKPFPDIPYLFASDSPKYVANNGVMRLPKNSPTLKALVEFCSTEYPVLPDDWIFNAAMTRAQFEELGGNGMVHISDLPWVFWGPDALTYFFNKYDEARFRSSNDMLYPLEGTTTGRLLEDGGFFEAELSEDCLSVHLFASELRRLLVQNDVYIDNNPMPNSYLARKLTEHDIDPRQAPIVSHWG